MANSTKTNATPFFAYKDVVSLSYDDVAASRDALMHRALRHIFANELSSYLLGLKDKKKPDGSRMYSDIEIALKGADWTKETVAELAAGSLAMPGAARLPREESVALEVADGMFRQMFADNPEVARPKINSNEWNLMFDNFRAIPDVAKTIAAETTRRLAAPKAVTGAKIDIAALRTKKAA